MIRPNRPGFGLACAVAALWTPACGSEPDEEQVPRPPAAAGAAAPASPADTMSPAVTMSPADTTSPRSFVGMVTYLADQASFIACDDGVTVPVAMEGGYLTLERSYLDARAEPGDPVLARIRGRVVPREGMEGGPRPTLVVDSLVALVPGVGCGDGEVDLPLEGTEWTLEAVPGGVDVPSGTGAFLVLDGEDHTVRGSTGCNGFSGSYDLAGGRLTFSLAATTRRACGSATGQVEADLLEALRVAGGYRILGHTLELLGEAGAVARFQASAEAR